MKNTMQNVITRMTAMMLIAAVALMMAACGGKADTSVNDETVVEEAVTATNAIETASEDSAAVQEVAPEATMTEATMIGEGSVQFTLEVVDGDGNTKYFIVNTDKKTVGEALLSYGIVEGEDGEYGLYVKTVYGITADYDVDQTYWAFYIDGEYASTGVDQTDIVAGSTYALKVEK